MLPGTIFGPLFFVFGLDVPGDVITVLITCSMDGGLLPGEVIVGEGELTMGGVSGILKKPFVLFAGNDNLVRSKDIKIILF